MSDCCPLGYLFNFILVLMEIHVCKQCILRCLIWAYTVFQNPIDGTLGTVERDVLGKHLILYLSN